MLITRVMFWTCWGPSERIEKASMDGTNRTVLHNTRIVWPNALTLDIPTQILFWADAYLDTVECSSTDGSNRQVIARNGVDHPFSIAVSFSGIYFTDWNNNSIRYIVNGKNEATVMNTFHTCERPYGIQVVNQYKQPIGRCRNIE